MTIITTHVLNDKTKSKQLQIFSKITTLPGISLSTSYWEPRLRAYQDHKIELSPALMKINYMDFTYAK